MYSNIYDRIISAENGYAEIEKIFQELEKKLLASIVRNVKYDQIVKEDYTEDYRRVTVSSLETIRVNKDSIEKAIKKVLNEIHS